MKPRKKPDPAKRRTRHEPPEIDEAVFAAQGLTGDHDQQVVIAARLMGLPEEEVRPAVLRARSPSRSTNVRIAGLGRAVVVERRIHRPSLPMGRR